jgi:hypothetical protein
MVAGRCIGGGFACQFQICQFSDEAHEWIVSTHIDTDMRVESAWHHIGTRTPFQYGWIIHEFRSKVLSRVGQGSEKRGGSPRRAAGFPPLTFLCERSAMEEELTKEEIDRRARELARRVMSTPYQKPSWPRRGKTPAPAAPPGAPTPDEPASDG